MLEGIYRMEEPERIAKGKIVEIPGKGKEEKTRKGRGPRGREFIQLKGLRKNDSEIEAKVRSALKQIDLKPDKKYTVEIKLKNVKGQTEPDIELVINKKNRFIVHTEKKGTVESPAEKLRVQEVIGNQPYLSTPARLFQSALAFFTQISFSKKEPRASTEQKELQDYRETRKALELSSNWFSPKAGEVGIKRDDRVKPALASAVKNAREIEKVLTKNPKYRTQEVKKLKERFYSEIAQGKEVVVPVGYMTPNGLRPVILHFYTKDKKTLVDIFYDDPKDLSTSNSATFTLDDPQRLADVLGQFLTLFFNPKAYSQEKQVDILQSREAFSALAGTEIKEGQEKIAEKLGAKIRAPAVPDSASSSFLGILGKLKTDYEETEQVLEVARTTGTTQTRVANWIESLLPVGQVSEFHKADLLYALCIDWVDRTLLNIDALSPQAQRETLEKCKLQIDFTIHKLAKDLADVEMRQERALERRVPQILKERQAEIEDRLISLAKVRSSSIVLESKALEQKVETGVRIVLPREVEQKPVIKPKTDVQITSATIGEIAAVRDRFDKKIEEIKGALSPQNQRAQKAQHLQKELEDYFKDKEVDFGNILQMIHENKDKKEIAEAFVELIWPIIVKDQKMAEFWLGRAELSKYKQFMIDILCNPHQVPDLEITGNEYFHRQFFSMLSFAERDQPNHQVGSSQNEREIIQLKGVIQEVEVTHAFRAYTQFRNILQKAQSVPQLSVDSYTQDIRTKTQESVGEIKKLRDLALKTTDLDQKKALYKEIAAKSFEVLGALPVVDLESSLDQFPFWKVLSHKERMEFMESLHDLQGAIWDANMRCSCPELTARQRLLLFKAESIGLILTRMEIRDVKKKIEDRLATTSSPLLDELKSDLLIYDDNGKPFVSWQRFKAKDFEKLRQVFGDVENLEFLAFDKLTFDPYGQKSFLTQELQNVLGNDPQLAKEVQGLKVAMLEEQDMTTSLLNPMPKLIADLDVSNPNNVHNRRFFFENCNTPGKVPTVSEEYIQNVMALTSTAAIQEGVEFPKHMQRLIDSVVFRKMLEFPEGTLFEKQSKKGSSYLQDASFELSCSFAKFEQEEVVFVPSERGVMKKEQQTRMRTQMQFVVKAQDEIRADVFVFGHPDKKMRPENPRTFALSVTRNTQLAKSTVESYGIGYENRKNFTIAQYIEYFSQQAAQKGLTLPSSILSRLVAVRMRNDNSNETSYDPEMVILALDFLTDSKHFPYLERENVQKYLEESLFAESLLHSAIVVNSAVFAERMDSLSQRIESLERSKAHPKVLAFLIALQNQLQNHVKEVRDSLKTNGFFDPILSQSTAFNSEGDHLEFIQKSIQGDTALYDKAPLTTVLERLDRISDSFKNSGEKTVGAVLALCKELENVEGKTQKAVEEKYALEEQILTLVKLLKKEDFEKLIQYDENVLLYLMQAVYDLQEPFYERPSVFRRDEVLPWFEKTVIPEIEKRQKLLFDFCKDNYPDSDVKRRLQNFEKTPELNLEHPYVSFSIDARTSVVLDLYNMQFVGTGDRALERKGKLPLTILQNKNVQQALGKTKESFTVTENRISSDEVHYLWEENNQKFEIVRRGENDYTIERTIDSVTYRFIPYSLEVKPSTHAEKLLQEHGLWQDVKNPSFVHVFTSGLQKPIEQSDFTVRPKGQSYQISTIRKVKNNKGEDVEKVLLVASSKSMYTTSLFPSVAVDDQVVLVDSVTEKVEEIAVRNKDIRFVRGQGADRKETWTCFVEGKEAGTLATIGQEKELISLFGKGWEKYVIPLVLKDGSSSFLVFPYPVQGGLGSDVEIVANTTPKPFIFTLGKEKVAPPEGYLYLAYRALVEADTASFSHQAERQYVHAKSFLDAQIRGLPKSSNPESFSQISKMIQEYITRDDPVLSRTDTLGIRLKLCTSILDYERRNADIVKKRAPGDAFHFRQQIDMLKREYDTRLKAKEAKSVDELRKERKQLVLLSSQEEQILQNNSRVVLSGLIAIRPEERKTLRPRKKNIRLKYCFAVSASKQRAIFQM